MSPTAGSAPCPGPATRPVAKTGEPLPPFRSFTEDHRDRTHTPWPPSPLKSAIGRSPTRQLPTGKGTVTPKCGALGKLMVPDAEAAWAKAKP